MDAFKQLAEAGPFHRPYVVSWNLTYRCNLKCEHCYLDAGGKPQVDDAAFSDRSELTTDECREVIDQLADFAPEALTILTGGEPLLRRDILEIVRHAADKKLWVVVGTNGVKITDTLAGLLKREGVRGMSLSLDAMDPARHDLFRRVQGAWRNTVEGAGILHGSGLPFIVQTTVGSHNAGELEEIARFAHEELSATVWNLYFLVPTGRGQFVSDMSPEAYDDVLDALRRIQDEYRGRMVANAKCAPHFVKTLLAEDPGSPGLRTYAGGAGGCPAGTHYMGIRPNGEVTPCPYLPVFGGSLKGSSLEELWSSSEPFVAIRKRNELGGRCGACELSRHCGGCRARAYGVTGDYMAEDPLCTHEPGRFDDAVVANATGVEYGGETAPELTWEPAARERIDRIPAFVRGMVVRSVESRCRARGVDRVTTELLEEIRASMPTPKLFGRRPGA
ncbi:MAG: radical SAM protein [Acidobacteriota bacterium]|nr:radical SAM protein [Acidobacteriota bacterium]